MKNNKQIQKSVVQNVSTSESEYDEQTQNAISLYEEKRLKSLRSLRCPNCFGPMKGDAIYVPLHRATLDGDDVFDIEGLTVDDYVTCS